MTTAQRRAWLARADALGRRAENLLLVGLLAALIILSATQILLRNFFSAGLPWADGLLRLLVLYVAVVGAVAAARDRRHIAIELVARALPAGGRRAAAAGVNLFSAAVTAVLAWQSVRFVLDSRAFEDVLLGSWPAWILQLILPFGFGLLSWRYGVHAVQAGLGITETRP